MKRFDICWSSDAERDLTNILQWYAEEAGPEVAHTVVRRIIDEVGRLDVFPERTRPGRVPGTREHPIHRLPYLAVICIDAETVHVLTVVHTRRRYPPES